MCFDKKKLEISKSKFNSDLTKLKLIVRNDKKILAIDSYNYINIKEIYLLVLQKILIIRFIMKMEILYI